MSWARLWLMVAALLAASSASAQTYTSGSTTYNFIDSSAHSKIGYNTTPYKFNASSGCGTAPPVLDDTLSDSIPIGFTFVFGASSYTSLYVMSNGRLQFGNTTCGSGTASVGPPQTYPYGYPNASMNGTMKVFGVDLDSTNLIDKPNYPSASKKTPCASIATCYVSVATLGNAPARQFVVTWKNVPEWVTSTNTSGSFDLQIILNEDGSFVYQYGNNISHGGTGTAQVGWQVSTTNYQVLSFGAATEPTANSAIKFFLPAPLANYAFDESAWVSGVANQVLDSSAGARSGSAMGTAQTSSTGKVCRSADIAPNSAAGKVDAVRTGVNIGDTALSLLGTGTVTLWYRANSAWSSSSAQLLDATAVNGQWFFLTKTAGGALLFEVKDSTGAVRSVTTPAQSFSANTWVHIAVTWNFNGNAGSNQDNLQVFVNAAAPTASAFTSSGTVTAQAGYLHVGDNVSGFVDTLGSVNSANGFIDEVQIYNYVLTTAQVNTVMNATRPCPAFVIDHLEIQHASGNGITCAPSTVTVRACQNASCSVPYTGGISGTLNATGSPAVNWDGSTGAASGSRFTIAAGSSSVTKSLQVTTPGSVLLGVGALSPSTSTGNTCNFGSPSCSFSAVDAGFVLSVPSHISDAVRAITVTAVKKADNSQACTPAFASVTKAVTFSCTYVNPATGTLPVRVGGAALNASNNLTAACSATGANVNLSFDASGVAQVNLQYADVGTMTLAARYAPSSGLESNLVMTGSAGFTTVPQGFKLSAIKCSTSGTGNCVATGAGNNPAPSPVSASVADTDPAFIAAGKNFSATVTAINASNNATPNYGKESSPEGVKLMVAVKLPSGGSAPPLTNASGFGSFSTGVATGTTFSWPEVGTITLTPVVASGNYLGANSVAEPSLGNVQGTPVNVGRFVPARFGLSTPSATLRSAAACTPASTFSYLDENFSLAFTLTAQNALGATTVNYQGGLAKLNPTVAGVWNLAGIGGSTVFSIGTSRLLLGASDGSWANGVAGITLEAQARRAAAPDGPFDTASFGIAPRDSDGVLMAAYDLAIAGGASDRTRLATVPLRFGRLRLMNAMGAQDRDLSMPLAAQYWNGSGFVDNTLDSCTRIAPSQVGFGNYRKTLIAADSNLAAGPVTVSAGRARLILSKPGGGRSGSFDVALSLSSSATASTCMAGFSPSPADAATAGAGMSYLRGAWCGSSYVKDPSARATFGLYRGADNLIYQRENY
ncbi:DUF6701 domain-containing protein [Roseateles toxinivorans]|uniref:MSHA biogenesis protein MshQ n=1 Tax=Roseateles toxinivorans TaxID=270368 RepID=A0A4R6QTS4_9BURK|nr:DUF6701 domain-containing protein [Roseateles toxinivorans]TDP74984.1 MSHA biogenesis protein MshQ [Roseateles toxinivorans]